MKLSENTLTVLKNFSSINSSILVNEGDVLQVANSGRGVYTLGKAVVEEKFPLTFAIFDLPKFLGAHSFLKDPELQFGETSVRLTSGKKSITFVYADTSTIKDANKLKVNMPTVDVTVDISQDVLDDAIKAASIMGLKHISVVGNGETIKLFSLTVEEGKKTTLSHSGLSEIDLETPTTENFEMIFEVDRLKLLSGSYTLNLSSSRIGHFVNKNQSLEYWIAADDTSSFGK